MCQAGKPQTLLGLSSSYLFCRRHLSAAANALSTLSNIKTRTRGSRPCSYALAQTRQRLGERFADRALGLVGKGSAEAVSDGQAETF